MTLKISDHSGAVEPERLMWRDTASMWVSWFWQTD
jgi:hypothetical protein